MLHRQVYDIIAAEPLSHESGDDQVQGRMRYYRSRPDLAFSEARSPWR